MPSGYKHLTLEARSQIYALLSTNLTQSEIASHLNVSPSTISREISRNTGGKGYRHQQADKMATERRHTASSRPTRMTPDVIKMVEARLNEQWSPEQISGRLGLQGIQVSHETIYLHVWADKSAGGKLYQNLRRAGKKYNRRSSGKAGRGCIPNRVDIAARPAVVEEKSRLGDWEGDTIIGAQQKGAILTLVDRKSKFTLMAQLGTKTAENVARAVENVFEREPAAIVRTITFDNGKEFSAHEKITEATNAQCYFATPYHSWERGLNEHTNGLIRQFAPKKTDLRKLPDEKIQIIEDKLNDRPRKELDYLTPREVLHGIKKATPDILRC